MPGHRACSIEDAVLMTRAATKAQCAGVLLLPPFYYKGISDDGLFAFFSELIERVGEEQAPAVSVPHPAVCSLGFSLALIERLLKPTRRRSLVSRTARATSTTRCGHQELSAAAGVSRFGSVLAGRIARRWCRLHHGQLGNINAKAIQAGP